MYHAETIVIGTKGRGTYEITNHVQRVAQASGIERGLCNIFVHHTSASLIICENAEPEVRRDLERFFARLVPDGNSEFLHNDEGPDDMPAHIRSIITQSSLTIPVDNGLCDLGTWQGIFLWEHRTAPHRRRFTIAILG